ncbi:MAG: hypothetical protein CMF59_03070 [Leptospiraceae bacterium]|nr:hypothetical protein [Leptospiraceae bacterium]
MLVFPDICLFPPRRPGSADDWNSGNELVDGSTLPLESFAPGMTSLALRKTGFAGSGRPVRGWHFVSKVLTIE